MEYLVIHLLTDAKMEDLSYSSFSKYLGYEEDHE